MKFWIKVDPAGFTLEYPSKLAELYWFMGAHGIDYVVPDQKDIPTGPHVRVVVLEFDLPHDQAMMLKLRFPFFDVEALITELEENESKESSCPHRRVTIRYDKLRETFGLS